MSEFSLALCCSVCLAYPPIIHIWCSLTSHTCPMIHFVSICMLSPTFLELDLPAPALACAPRFRDPLFDFYACVVRFFGRCKHTRSRQQQGRRAHVWILVGLVGIIVGKDGSHTSLVGSSQLESRLYSCNIFLHHHLPQRVFHRLNSRGTTRRRPTGSGYCSDY